MGQRFHKSMNHNKYKQHLPAHTHHAYSPEMAKVSKKKQVTSNKAKAQSTKAGKQRACGTDGEIDEEELSVSVTHRRKKARHSVEIVDENSGLEIEEIDVTPKSTSDDSDEVRSHIHDTDFIAHLDERVMASKSGIKLKLGHLTQ